VTTITDVAPIMNWIYIDRNTHEVKYGVRLDAQPHLTGPFDCTRQDRRLTFDNWEGWCAVEEFPTLWALYYDLDDDGLKGKAPKGARVLEIELSRKEKRFAKDSEARQQDQTTKRKVDAEADVPVDEGVTAQVDVKTPGVVGIEGDVDDESSQGPRKPFIIPKMQLFQDLPYLVTKVPPVPSTPPPVYEMNVFSKTRSSPTPSVRHSYVSPPAPAPVPLSITTPLQTIPFRRKPTRLSTETSLVPSVPLEAEPSDKEQSAPPAQPPTSSENASPIQTTSPQDASSIQTASPNEMRKTPKLNRKSGTRTLAQAQKFEAWARGQAPKALSLKKENGSPPRPTSVATSSSSTYSASSQTAVSEANEMDTNRTDVNTLPRVTKASLLPTTNMVERDQAPMKPCDPAVFRDTKLPLEDTQQREDIVASNSRLNTRGTLQRIPLFRRKPSVDRTPTASSSPENQLKPSSSQIPLKNKPSTWSSITRNNTKIPEPIRRPSASQTSSSLSSQQFPNIPTTARPASAPKPPTGANSTVVPAKRKGMSSTMTSGTGNRGMTLRVGGNEAAYDVLPRLARSRTNSNLYREIGELVREPGRAVSGRREERIDLERDVERILPLRREETEWRNGTGRLWGGDQEGREGRRILPVTRRRGSGDR
jgi:hypothetical protein